MKDQAAALRDRPMRTELPEVPAESPAIVVGGGKGGVGVSVLATLLASGLAASGRRVLLMDASFNQGNLHVLLGHAPRLTLGSVVAGDAAPEEIVVPVADNLWLLPAESGAEDLHQLTTMDRARLHVRLAALMDDYDVTVVDAGTGIESVLRSVHARATRVVAVATPEPAALADTYALIKILSLETPSVPVDVVVNRTLDAHEAEASWARLEGAADRFLGRTLGRLGSLPEDPSLARAVRKSEGLTLHHALAASLVERLIASFPEPLAAGRSHS